LCLVIAWWNGNTVIVWKWIHHHKCLHGNKDELFIGNSRTILLMHLRWEKNHFCQAHHLIITIHLSPGEERENKHFIEMNKYNQTQLQQISEQCSHSLPCCLTNCATNLYR
jgi:hypothetical protein